MANLAMGQLCMYKVVEYFRRNRVGRKQPNVSFFYEKKMIKLQEYERDKEGKEFGQQEKIHFHTPVSQG